MLVDASSNRRCVIWFGEPTSTERQLLAASGWSLRVVGAQSAAEIGMRMGDVIVGLFDMRKDFRNYLEHAESWIQQQAPHALFAFTASHTALDQEPRLTRILSTCTNTFLMPLDNSAFTSALNKSALPLKADNNDEVLDELIGGSAPMLAIKACLRRFGPVDLPVLITGETGTGKEVAARALHALSTRRERPFAAVNCGALPSSLVQSELFGHERGAFTGANARRAGLFEAANGGTVFLDEIGDLPLEAQTNLLRVLQEGGIERLGSHQTVKVDVRVLAATHVDLEQAIAQGRFREDLYYRLNVLRVRMPALRERREDLEPLAQHFLGRFRERHKVRPHGFTAQARRAMADFDWPGNVRELLNRVQRAAITTDTPLIDADALELGAANAAKGSALTEVRSQAEKNTLLGALRACNWNISACARRMHVSRVTIYRLCRKHQLAIDGSH